MGFRSFVFSLTWTAVIGSAAAFAAPKAGDRVFVHAAGDLYAYPATVLGPKEKKLEVLYDVGGKREVVAESALQPMAIGIGSRVYGNWQKRGAYYPGTVTLVTGEKVRIQYEDGDQEATSVSDLRIVAGKPEVACVVGEALFVAIDPTGIFYYPGTVLSVNDERIRVNVAGSAEEFTVPADRTRTLVLKKGDRVLGRWQNGPSYYPGRIRNIEKERVEVAYDDGDVEWTSAGLTILMPDKPAATGPGHCLDKKKSHAARKTPLEVPPVPALPRDTGKQAQSI